MLPGFLSIDVIFYIFSLKYTYFEFLVFCLYNLVMKDGFMETSLTMRCNFAKTIHVRGLENTLFRYMFKIVPKGKVFFRGTSKAHLVSQIT